MLMLSSILKMLIAESKITESELARRTGVGQPVIHRMASGETDNPKVKTLSPIANYFSLTISQLIGDDPLPKDRIPGTHNPNVQFWAKAPLLTWEQVLHWPNHVAQASEQTFISTDINVSDHAYALMVKDSTMLPRFPERTLLIIDPALKPQDKDFVIAHIKGQKQATFKQLLIDGDDSYLKPLNPDFNTVLMDKEYVLLGVMVQARMDFKGLHSMTKKLAQKTAPVQFEE